MARGIMNFLHDGVWLLLNTHFDLHQLPAQDLKASVLKCYTALSSDDSLLFLSDQECFHTLCLID